MRIDRIGVFARAPGALTGRAIADAVQATGRDDVGACGCGAAVIAQLQGRSCFTGGDRSSSRVALRVKPVAQVSAAQYLLTLIAPHSDVRAAQRVPVEGVAVDIEPDRIGRLNHQRRVQAVLLVRTGAEMVMREHRAQGVVLAVFGVEDRVGIPALHGALRAAERTVSRQYFQRQLFGIFRAEALFLQGQAIGIALAILLEKRVGFELERRISILGCGHVVGADALTHLFGREGAVLIIPAIARTIRRCHVELHQVNMLADGVGRCVDLEVVQRQRIRQEIAVLEVDAVARIGAKKQGLGQPVARAGVDDVGDVVFKCQDARLRIKPSMAIDRQFSLDHSGAVFATWCAGRAGVSVGRAARRLAPIDLKYCRGCRRGWLARNPASAFGHVAAVFLLPGRVRMRCSANLCRREAAALQRARMKLHRLAL